MTYPAELAEAVAVLDAAEGTGDAVTLPWASYRRFTWGNPVSAADPCRAGPGTARSSPTRWPSSGGGWPGEDPRAREIGAVVAEPQGPLADRLAALGVGWVLVYRDQLGAADLDTAGLTPEVEGPDVTLYRVRGPVREAPEADRAVVVVAAADGLWALAGLVGVLGAAVTTVRRRASREVTDR